MAESSTSSRPVGPKFPAKANPFDIVGNWEDFLDKLSVEIPPLQETTSKFTRASNANARYWKSQVKFSSNGHESGSLKMNGCLIPFIEGAKYGGSYYYAILKRAVGEKIVAAAKAVDIPCLLVDPNKFHDDGRNWWSSVSADEKSTGILDADGNFETRDFARILAVSKEGAMLNADLTFYIRTSTDANQDRGPKNVYTISVAANRSYIADIGIDVEAPPLASKKGNKASRQDVATDALMSKLNKLAL